MCKEAMYRGVSEILKLHDRDLKVDQMGHLIVQVKGVLIDVAVHNTTRVEPLNDFHKVCHVTRQLARCDLSFVNVLDLFREVMVQKLFSPFGDTGF